jgi:hypothetical protein
VLLKDADRSRPRVERGAAQLIRTGCNFPGTQSLNHLPSRG